MDDKKYQKEYYQRNKEKLLSKAKAYYVDNRETILANKRRSDQSNAPQTIVVRDKYYRRYYGITLDEYNSLLEKQFGRCAICTTSPSPKRRLAVDHCHNTGKVRGLLCIKCNAGIGNLGDNIEILKTAIKYLES